MKTNAIDFEILEDGTISIKTGDLSGVNHVSADKLLANLAELTGGEVKIEKRERLSLGLNLRAAYDAHCADGHHHDNAERHSH